MYPVGSIERDFHDDRESSVDTTPLPFHERATEAQMLSQYRVFHRYESKECKLKQSMNEAIRDEEQVDQRSNQRDVSVEMFLSVAFHLFSLESNLSLVEMFAVWVTNS